MLFQPKYEKKISFVQKFYQSKTVIQENYEIKMTIRTN